MAEPGPTRIRRGPAPAGCDDAPRHETLPAGARVYVDRPLPFLVAHRSDDTEHSLARRVAAISPASILWPEHRAEAEVSACVRSVAVRQLEHCPRLLLIGLHDLPRDPSLGEDSARLEPFRFTIACSRDPAARAAAGELAADLAGLCIDLRAPRIEHPDDDAADALPAGLAGADARISWLTLGLPRIHLVPGGDGGIYPQVFHELETRVFDALLRAAAAFVAAASGGPAPQHRSLGRSRYIEAAVVADRELARISRSFDFLLGVSPINTVEQFERCRGQRAPKPRFRYRPLTIDPVRAKRALHAIDLRAVEDPVLETLFQQKRQELDLQLTLLQCRNTPPFRHGSVMLYGAVEAGLLEDARSILARVAEAPGGNAEMVDAHAVRDAAQQMIARYRHKVPAFKAEACLREDLAPGLMVSGSSMLVSSATRMRRARLDALLQHEVGVHVLTCINGGQQGLGIFGAGLAGYEGVQEGLGVFAEYLVGGLTPARLRLLAARVVVVDAMLDGAAFGDCHRMLVEEHGFAARTAFNIVARIFRSGGLAKDAIYLRGLRQVFAFVASGRDLDPFWLGKIAEAHVPMVEELQARGILRAPAAIPEFLIRPEARTRIARIRAGGALLDHLQDPAPC